MAMGAPVELIAAEAKAANFQVLPENFQAVKLFLSLGTQWRIGMNGATGLDYTAVIATLKLLKIKDQKQVFHKIQIIEGSVLAALREK